MVIVILFLIGLLSAVLGSLIGIGGGIIIVPALIFFGRLDILHHISPQSAVGLSLMVMIFTGLSATFSYVRAGRTDQKSAWLFIAGSAPGSIAGSFLNDYIPQTAFSIGFGLFMITLSFIMMLNNRIPPLKLKSGQKRSFTDSEGKVWHYKVQPVIAISAAFFVGILSGLFGIGGGSLMVPLMVLAFGMPAAVAVGTSMMMVLLSAVVSVTSHIALGHMIWIDVLPLGIGAYLGAKVGSALNQRIKDNVIIIIFRIVLILVGADLILEAIF